MHRHIKRSIPLVTILWSLAAFGQGTPGAFEGIYRVGPTTCTVTPVKMAFEIRWAKGRGAMMFFYDMDSPHGPFSYVSERKPRGFDRFVFADRHLSTGVFIRDDDIQFPVLKQTTSKNLRGN